MKSNPISIYIAGDAAKAKDICRRFCFSVGLCVTLAPTTFIYTGGAEEGVEVKLQMYPRFPTTPADLESKAHALAQVLREELYQHSVMIVFPDRTEWFSDREVA